MNFRELFPLVDFTESYTFENCATLHDFLQECVVIYDGPALHDERVREACLSVYMAFRDHFPGYVQTLNSETKYRLDQAIEKAPPKIIKLRRVVIGALARVA